MRADQRKFHYIYKITREDGKFYIGMHSTDVLEDGYFGSGTLLARSIRKHGKEKHAKEILEFLPSRKELKEREKALVNEELLGDKRCMNLKLGGEGGGKFLNEEHQRKCSLAGASSGGKSTASLSDFKTMMGSAGGLQTGKNLRLGLHAPAFQDKRHSEESKRRIGAANAKMTGESNSQFGTRWVTDGVKPVKIPAIEVEKYCSAGFRLGRK